MRPLAIAFVIALAGAATASAEPAVDRLVQALGAGRSASEPVTEASIVRDLSGVTLSTAQAGALWSVLADTENQSLLTLPVLRALIGAGASPEAREAMWNELAGQAEGKASSKANPSLLTTFEHHRRDLLPLLGGVAETESSGNAMVDLMTKTRVFGDRLDDGVKWIGTNHPAALARRIERERERGRPVAWEAAGLEQMLRWKDRHIVSTARDVPKTLAALDAAGETFVVMFNMLHALDDGWRHKMLRGLGPSEVFDAVVAGETELYRMGTSGYRNFMHAIIQKGIAESGSLEAFLEKSAAARLGLDARRDLGRRGIVYLRVVSAFGLLDPVMAMVKDRPRFIELAVASLGDPAMFENNATVLLDLLTARTTSTSAVAFRKDLLDRLYRRHGEESEPDRKGIYGGLLSVYQSITGDRRDAEIDRAFPIDRDLKKTPFNELFARSRDGSHVHRMFMRFDEDIDASSSFTSFRASMVARGAESSNGELFEAWRLRKGNRSVEIYANKPTAAGVSKGIAEIARTLDGAHVHSVVGRGHSGIITPLRTDSVRLLGSRTSRVATVILGTCGGTASVRELIDTFGYRLYVSTRSTGRLVLNNALINTYVTALLDLAPGERLAITDVLSRSMGPYLKPGTDAEMRENAEFYHANAAGVYAALLFDRHVRGKAITTTDADTATAEPVVLSWGPAEPTRAVTGGTSRATRGSAAPSESASAPAAPASSVTWMPPALQTH